MTNIKKATFGFYEELNDFLPSTKRKTRFKHSFVNNTSTQFCLGTTLKALLIF